MGTKTDRPAFTPALMGLNPDLARFAVDDVTIADGRVRLSVAGELDLASGPQLVEHLDRHRLAGHDVELDLSRLDFADSTGIAVLIRAMDQFSSAGCRFDIAPDLSPQVERVLMLVGLLGRFRTPASQDLAEPH